MLAVYGAITAIIGAFDIVYNALWLPRTSVPFDLPEWVVIFELAWALVSFDIVIRHRRAPAAVSLAASYIVYATLAVGYSFWLGSKHGTVTDAMVPLGWKIFDLGVGAWLVVGGLRAVREFRNTSAA